MITTRLLNSSATMRTMQGMSRPPKPSAPIQKIFEENKPKKQVQDSKRHDNQVARQVIEKQKARFEKREANNKPEASETFDTALGEGMHLFKTVTRPTKKMRQAYLLKSRARKLAQQKDPRTIGAIARQREALKHKKVAEITAEISRNNSRLKEDTIEACFLGLFAAVAAIGIAAMAYV